MKKKLVMLALGAAIVLSACGSKQTKEEREAQEYYENELGFDKEDAAELANAFYGNSEEKADAEPTEAEEEVEEGFTIAEAKPEIVNASFADAKIQVYDAVVDLFEIGSIAQLLKDEDEKQERITFLETHRMGTAQELYDQVSGWTEWTGEELQELRAETSGWTGWSGPDFNPDQMVLNENIGILRFQPPHPQSWSTAALVAIVYFNFSGETKKLGECDALVYFDLHLLSSGTTRQFIGPYLYTAGGINAEDPHWDYSTLTDYLKETGVEYDEQQRGSGIIISFKMEDTMVQIYDDKTYDLIYTFGIDANDADLKYIIVSRQ